MDRRIAVRAIIVKDGKLLAMKAKPYDDRVTGDIWFTIGGGLDPGEALVPALRREVLEETGVEPVIGNLLYVQQFKDERREHLEFFFHVTNADDYLNLDVSASSHGAIEIDEIGFIDDSKAKDILPVFLREESFDNIADQPTKFFSYL